MRSNSLLKCQHFVRNKICLNGASGRQQSRKNPLLFRIPKLSLISRVLLVSFLDIWSLLTPKNGHIRISCRRRPTTVVLYIQTFARSNLVGSSDVVFSRGRECDSVEPNSRSPFMNIWWWGFISFLMIRVEPHLSWLDVRFEYFSVKFQWQYD